MPGAKYHFFELLQFQLKLLYPVFRLLVKRLVVYVWEHLHEKQKCIIRMKYTRYFINKPCPVVDIFYGIL